MLLRWWREPDFLLGQKPGLACGEPLHCCVEPVEDLFVWSASVHA